MRPARNYSLLRKIICTDQIYINPTQLVRLTFMHNLIYPHLIQIHILKKQESNLLYLKQQFPWKACLQIGLLQVLKASEKKGTVPSTFKRTTLLLFSLGHPCVQNEKLNKRKVPGIWKPSFSSHPLAPERCSGPSEGLQLFYFWAEVKVCTQRHLSSSLEVSEI